MLRFICAIALALTLSACGTTLQFAADTFGVDVVSESVRQKAYKAALITFVAWGGIPSEECKAGTVPSKDCIGGVQKLFYKYGSLTPCKENTPSTILCRDDQTWSKLKAIEDATTHTLAATGPLIEAGDSDAEVLLALPSAVQDARAAVERALKGETQ